MAEEFPESAGGLRAGFPAGSRVGAYMLEELIGAGGMAVVFRAVDQRLGRRVALKILAPALALDEGFRRRFLRESRAAAAVDDPHIIPVHEAGEADGVLFIAMRFVPGRDVCTLMHREGLLPADRVAAIVSPVASALDTAHAAGLVHRDVKPANMLLDTRPGRPDHVYLSDFGLSKGALPSVGLTGSGQFLGTPNYTAPEQIEGTSVDGRTDQYALACAAFEMLTGEPPFQRDEATAVIWAHLSAPPPPLSSRRPDLPVAADQVFARALAKAPGQRYARCQDFADALRKALGLLPYHSDPGVMAPPARPAADHPATQIARSPRPAALHSDGMAATADVVSPVPRHAGAWDGAHQGKRPGRGHSVPIVFAVIGILAVGVAAGLFLVSRPSNGSANSPGRSSQGVRSQAAAKPPTSVPDNIWVAQLASVPVSAGKAALHHMLDEVRAEVPGAEYLASSDYASLRPHFWMVYYTGSFGNGEQALAYCSAHGRTTRNACVGRFLSHSRTDRIYICLPPSSSPTGGCNRP